MRLDLRFSERPLESLWCQAVVALVFKGHPLVGESISGLDAKMAGLLSYLETKGFFTASRGETLLLAGQQTIAADKVLLKGLGQREHFSADNLSEGVKDIGECLDRMRICDVAISIPMTEELEAQYAFLLELSSRQLVDAFLKTHGGEDHFLAKIVFSVDRRFSGSLESMLRRLREYFSTLLDYALVLDPEMPGQNSPRPNNNQAGRFS
jgi:hypothetical protein